MNKILLLSIIFFLCSCNQQTIYSGKILNQEDFENINYKNKSILIDKLGMPSFIDPIENKFFYFSQKKIKTSLVNEKIEYSYIFVFKFDNTDQIIQSNSYDLLRKDEIKLVKEETKNNVIKRGLIEKVFGGVGSRQELPTTP